MKKVISLVLAWCAALPFALTSCGKKSAEVSFGMGAHAYYSAEKSASEEAAGYGKITVAVAAIVADKNGKILECELDMAENKGEFTYEGKCVAAGEFKTKGELGDAYGMKKASAAGKEWYEQADAFEDAAEGKTLDEVKKLLATGESEIVRAGCTIDTSDFIAAIENAFANAESVAVGGEYDAELGFVSVQEECRDASDEADGVNKISTVFTAALTGGDGKVISLFTDAAEAKFTFDTQGHAVFDVSADVKTKKAQGDAYGMAKYGTDRNGDGKVLEWHLQAAEFEKYCVGKTAAEIARLAGTDGYGNAELQNAGCTVAVADFVKAALKALE